MTFKSFNIQTDTFPAVIMGLNFLKKVGLLTSRQSPQEEIKLLKTSLQRLWCDERHMRDAYETSSCITSSSRRRKNAHEQFKLGIATVC